MRNIAYKTHLMLVFGGFTTSSISHRGLRKINQYNQLDSIVNPSKKNDSLNIDYLLKLMSKKKYLSPSDEKQYYNRLCFFYKHNI